MGYLFRIDNDNIIDATFRGSIGRFINHSCDPNCFARTILVDNSPRIVIYSKKRIVPATRSPLTTSSSARKKSSPATAEPPTVLAILIDDPVLCQCTVSVSCLNG